MGGFKLGKMTLGSVFKKPETVLYPMQEKPKPEGLKGKVKIDRSTCILCGICEKRCPCQGIKVDKKERTWSLNHYRCIQCYYCINECPKNSLYMDSKFTAVTGKIDREVFVIPEQPKKKKEAPKPAAAAEPVIEPTGDAEMDAKLAKLPYEKAVKLRAAFMAKKAKSEGSAE